MESRILIVSEDLVRTRNYLLGRRPYERAGFWICGITRLPESLRFAVRQFVPVPDESLNVQEEGTITISPLFTAEVLQRCRKEGLSVLVLHSHPGSTENVHFSRTDWHGERTLLKSVYGRLDAGVHGAVVFGEDSIAARWWTPALDQPTPFDLIRELGGVMRDWPPDNAEVKIEQEVGEAFDRQVRVFGEQGQLRLAQLVVGVVGAGGTGSLTVQQLARLGVGRILVIDDDVVELTNVPRVVGATVDDARQSVQKTAVARRHGEGLPTQVVIESIAGNIRDHSVSRELRRCDIVFSCVDRHYPRAILNQFAQQYFVPVIDMGIQLQPDGTGRIRGAGGRVAVVRPGGWCLWCTGDISAKEVRLEGLPPEHRADEQERGYAGPDVPAPAVISLNGVVSSLAVTEFLQLVLGFAGADYGVGRRLYRILDGRVSEANDVPQQDCYVCRGRFKGLGDAGELP